MWHKVCNIESYVILLLNHLVKLINHKLLIDTFFQEGKKRWYFYFKLKELPKANNNSLKLKTKINGKKTDFLEMLEDVAVNLEEGCKILRVFILL